MQSRIPNWFFGFNFNFGKDSVFQIKYDILEQPSPPPTENFLLLDGTDFLLLDGTNLLLL